MQARTRRIYEFGRFRLDGDEGVLLKEGRPAPLTPKVFDLLLLLVESSGHLVLKEEIMSRLWPESFVEEDNVNRNISTLRRALDDSPNNPSYIETVSKRGYRFVAAVAEVETDETELILERRTSAEIITDEEEITDASGIEEATLTAMGHAAAARVKERFSLAGQADGVLAAWRAVT